MEEVINEATKGDKNEVNKETSNRNEIEQEDNNSEIETLDDFIG